MKKFILGFITGGIICATLTGFAVEYAVTVNPFPVKVNGVETAIEGYNINDNTYFKLRDVADAVGGFQVGFTDNTITIDISATEQSLSPITHNDTESYDGIHITNFEGQLYVSTSDIENKYDTYNSLMYFGIGGFYDIEGNKILDSILTHPEHSSLIPLDYYNHTLLPLLIKYCT